MTFVTRKNLLRALKNVRRDAKSGTIKRPLSGICLNVCIQFRYDFDYAHLYPYFNTWPKTTGSHAYPVPDDGAFHRWEGEAYELRVELLNHIIRELEAEIAS
jgi:hypothetical protein